MGKLRDNPVTSGTYGAHHLDARGDQTHTARADESSADIAAVGAVTAKDYGARAAKERGGWAIISEYSHWAKANNVCLVAVPAVLLHFARYDMDPVERDFYADLPDRVRKEGVRYAGAPRDFMYPSSWFFDTANHLQDWARERHTARLIKILNRDPRSYCDAG